MSELKNLAAKIAAVSGELVSIPKTKHQGATVPYAFRSIDEVMNALNPLLEKYKLTLSISIIDRKLTQVTSGKGTAGYAAEVVINLNVTDGVETISTQEWALSVDYSDKSPTQAMSMAYKYALIRMFVVTTKDIIVNDADYRAVEMAAPTQPDNKKLFVQQLTKAGIYPEFSAKTKEFMTSCFVRWEASTDKDDVINQIADELNQLNVFLNSQK